MRYLYEAEFEDGTRFVQPADDSSLLKPGLKSSKYDFLTMCIASPPRRLTFKGPHVASYDFREGQFTIDGWEVQPGMNIAEFDAEWVEGDPAQGHYFRRVIRNVQTGDCDVSYCFGDRATSGVKNYLSLS